MGMVDFGFMFQRYVVLTNAAAEGARVASLPGYTTADVTAACHAYATDGGVAGRSRGPRRRRSRSGRRRVGTWPGSQVTVTHVYTCNTSVRLRRSSSGRGGSVTLTSRATMRHQVRLKRIK